MLLTNRLDHLQNRLHVLRWRCRPTEKLSEVFLLLLGIWWVTIMRQGLAMEEIGHEDLVLVGGIGVGEDVGALDGLGAVAEDVVDDENGGGGGGGAGGVWGSELVRGCAEE